MKVNAVVFRRRQACLEFARQIDLAVHRLGLNGVGGVAVRSPIHRFAVDPDFMVGVGARRQIRRQARRRGLQFFMDAVVMMRRGAGHDVALHVAAGAERGQQAGVDAGYCGVQIALDDAVKLDALTAGEAQRPLSILAGQVVHGEVLIRRNPAAGNFAADHEHIVFAEAFGAAALAGVAVFLLIGAVELEQLFILLAEAVGVLPQLVGDGAAQRLTGFLDAFRGRALRRGRGDWPRRGRAVKGGSFGGHEWFLKHLGRANKAIFTKFTRM